LDLANSRRKWSKDDDQHTECTTTNSTATRKLASRDALDGVQNLKAAPSRNSLEAESRRDEHVPHSICTLPAQIQSILGRCANCSSDQSHGHRINSVGNFSDMQRRLSITSQINGLPTLPFTPFGDNRAPFFGNIRQKSPSGDLPRFIKPLPAKIGPEEISYLEKKGALTVPKGTLRSEMLRAYVEFVHPYMPLLDLHDFLTVIDKQDGSNGKVSLILFQAVMFAGSAFVDMQYLHSAGYSTRKDARKDFFQKTRVSHTLSTKSRSRCSAELVTTSVGHSDVQRHFTCKHVKEPQHGLTA
jgi:hypothetical protein